MKSKDPYVLHIKNMVCPRCIMAVESVLKDMKIPYQKVELGQVLLAKPMASDDRDQFDKRIKALGFDILEPGNSALISKIKILVIEQIHHTVDPLTVNFSTFISDQLQHEYTSLSRLFSSIEGVTIEKFITQQKIEKVKELLFYDELSLSEIAFRMHYSSSAYLSTQFKKETGMTPTAFKKNHQPSHRHLDSL